MLEKSSGSGGAEERLAWGQMGGRAPCYEAFEVGQVRDGAGAGVSGRKRANVS